MSTNSSSTYRINGLIFTLILLIVSPLAAAQIKATLTDDRGNILPNVTVTEKQSGFTTVTNPQGQFTIDVETGMKEVALIFKREGYHPKEKTVPIDDGELTIKVYLIPQDYDLQKITVTAMNRGKRAIDVPMAEHSISTSEIRERMSENVVETIADTTGVSFIGSGGLHVTPTIRGLARRRVLILVDGHRVTSDRRAGTSPAFIQPELAGSVEVVRTGASVLYGSDAIGGVINILTRTEGKITRPAYERNSVNLIYNSSNNRVGTGITYGLSPGKWNIYAGFQYSNAGDYESPEDTVYHSGFKYYSGLFDLAYSDEKKEFYLGYIGGVGNDIGKPDRANERFDFTYVPVESHHYLRMGYKQKDIFKNSSLNLSLFFNPSLYRLDKVSTDDDKIERAETRAFNLGIKASLDRKISESLFYQFGVEWFSRQNVKTENAILNLGENVQSSFFPMDNGSRNDISAFLSFDYRGIESFELNGGVRYTFFSIDAVADGTNQDKNSGAASFFLAATKRFSDSVALFVNVSRAFRFPALSESFYTGLTGRRFVIGNPDLDSESSINVDLGLKVSTRKIFMGVYLFTDHIKKMIERYRVSGDIYTFDNINQGRILGSELELRYQPSPGLDFFGHFFYYHGKSTGSDSDDPLNDIPAPRILLGGKYFIDRLWVELSWLYSFKKDDPGPSEEANDAFNVADIKAGYYFSSAFFIDLKVGNVFNTKYFPNSDPDIPLAKGINVSAGVHYYF